MDDQEYKRLKRFIVISWSILLVVVVGLAIWGSYEIKNLKEIVAQKPQSQIVEKPIKGIDGKNGKDGISIIGPIGPAGSRGERGKTGAAGKSVRGDKGEQGDAGRIVFVRANPITGDQECKYAGDDDWQPISECSQ